jgi:hypothetical protein
MPLLEPLHAHVLQLEGISQSAAAVDLETLGTALARFMQRQGGVSQLVDAVVAVVAARSGMSKEALRALLTGAASAATAATGLPARKPRPAALWSALRSPYALAVAAVVDTGT